jgi:hypothetical protein
MDDHRAEPLSDVVINVSGRLTPVTGYPIRTFSSFFYPMAGYPCLMAAWWNVPMCRYFFITAIVLSPFRSDPYMPVRRRRGAMYHGGVWPDIYVNMLGLHLRSAEQQACAQNCDEKYFLHKKLFT